jgi:O-antigen ligase
MSNQRFRDFKRPKFYKHSGLFVIVGLILLHLSEPMYFVGGDTTRLGSLALGFGLILAAAYLRTRRNLFRHVPFVIGSGAYFTVLIFLSYLQNHMLWNDGRQQVFCVVCIFMFWTGFILAREKRQDFVSADKWSLVGVAGVAIVCLLAFLRFVKDVSFEGSERRFGETVLNPVGVAYANTCLGLVFVVLGILNKNLIRSVVYLLAACCAFFVVLSSASRGALIWGSCALVFLLLLNRNRKYFSAKNLAIAVGSFLVLIPICAALYTTNYAIAERIDILIGRFITMFDSLFGGGQAGTDRSISARQILLQDWISTFDQWIWLGEKNYEVYPHNQWLEILLRFGLMGIPLLIMSVVLFFGLCWDVLTRKMHPDVEFSLIATLFVYAYLQSMSSLSLQMNRALWLGFGYLIGYYVERSKRRRRS